MKAKGKVQIIAGACPVPECRGNIMVNYKGRGRYKCVKCSRIFLTAGEVERSKRFQNVIKEQD